MSFLLDTNIWLESMLDQERSAEVAELLALIPTDQLHLTDFSLHSIGVILYRLKQYQTYSKFIEDTLIDGDVRLLSVPPGAMAELLGVAQQFNLDFDDAYQYIAAQRHNLTFISLDKDFDRTERGRQTPREVARILAVKDEDE